MNKHWKRLLGMLAAIVWLSVGLASPASPQTSQAIVVANCGTPVGTPVAGFPYPIEMNTAGQVCTTGGGGGGGGGAVTAAVGSYVAGYSPDLLTLLSIAQAPNPCRAAVNLPPSYTDGQPAPQQCAADGKIVVAFAPDSLVFSTGEITLNGTTPVTAYTSPGSTNHIKILGGLCARSATDVGTTEARVYVNDVTASGNPDYLPLPIVPSGGASILGHIGGPWTVTATSGGNVVLQITTQAGVTGSCEFWIYLSSL